MPKVIIITNVDLEGYYKYTLDYLDAKYHRNHYSEIPPWSHNPRPTDGKHSDLNNWAQRQGGHGDGKTIR